MKKQGSSLLWFALAGVSMGALWLLAAHPAYARDYDYDYLADRYNHGGRRGTPAHTAAFKPWVIDGETARYCIGFTGSQNRQGTQAAIADWESQYAFPFSDFTHQCGPGLSMDVVHNENPDQWPNYPCKDRPGCVNHSWQRDNVRGGYYVRYNRIWANTRDYDFTKTGMRATITHELGHVYGLHEAYEDDWFEPGWDGNDDPPPGPCVPDNISIMNSAVGNGITVTGGCTTNSVSARDFSFGHWFNVMNLSSFQPKNMDSEKVSTNIMLYSWDDASPTEAGYSSYILYWTGNDWDVVSYSYYSDGVGPGDPWQTNELTAGYNRPSYEPVGWYIPCIYVNSGIIGDRYWTCADHSRWLGS